MEWISYTFWTGGVMKTDLYRYLYTLGACDEALEWIEENSLNDPQVAWDTCPDASWLLWFVAKHLGNPGWPTHRELVSATCDCAEAVLYLIPKGEDRPRIAIETVRRLVAGEATLKECEKAVTMACHVARYRAYDARAVSHAAYAACTVYAACAPFATSAPYAATRAAKAIEHSGGDYQKALACLAGIVRKRLYIGRVEL
jgi:hypothetical protein